jgi:SAM-dependent methyltransferase
MSDLPLMYGELAEWWPILSCPEDYLEEAGIFRATLEAHARRPLISVLELGSGGGNNASHMKARFAMALVDRSPGMLAVSRRLNPECEHIQGDMRDIRLGRKFDAVFVHDAVMYLTSEDDLSAAMRTAFEHCEVGGPALFVPDFTSETYAPYSDHGGHDGDGRSLRYLEWAHDRAPIGRTYDTDFVYLLRDAGGARVLHETHTFGLFARDQWLRLLHGVGFDACAVPYEHSEFHDGARDMFVGVRL